MSIEKIRLRHRTLLKLPTENKSISQFLENANNFFQGSIINRILVTDKSQSILELKRRNPQFVKQFNHELTELANFYLKKEKPYLSYLSDRHQMDYENLQAELYDIEFDGSNSLVVAIEFITKEYILIKNFGHFLLLSNDDESTLQNETFMIELKADFSIHAYSS